jgi:predicted RNA-binding protein with RPS1 domain
MTYEEAKAYKQQLEEVNKVKSKVLNSFEKNDMGFSPDHIRALPEYKKAEKEYDKSFSELRNFNSWFTKMFKKEYAADRKNRYKRAN